MRKGIVLFILFFIHSELSAQKNKASFYQVETDNSYSIARKQILDSLQAVMGKLPDISAPEKIAIIYRDSLHTNRYTRYLITFSPAKSEEVTAYLYMPENSDTGQKLPGMIVLHGTGALGKRLVDGESDLPNRAQAKELAERGYVVIAPDYPSMGEQEDYDFHSDRYVSGTMKGVFNHIRCLDLLTQLKQVDNSRIGALGHSLGGHNAMFLGAFDERVKVVVSSSGWTLLDNYNIGDSYGGRLGPWAQDRYMPYFRTKYKLDGSIIPFDFDDIIAAIAPRAFFSNSPVSDSNFDVEGVKKGIENARKDYRYLNKEENLQVRYPDAEHDFPTDTRRESYEFIDRILEHVPNKHVIE